MEITLKNALLFFAGFFIVEIIVAKLFGEVGLYSYFALFIGYLFGDNWGFGRGRKIGHQEAHTEIEEMFEREHSEKQHTRKI